MEFTVDDRVHLVRDKLLDGGIAISSGTCGTIRGVVLEFGYYTVQFDNDNFPRVILAMDLGPGCPQNNT